MADKFQPLKKARSSRQIETSLHVSTASQMSTETIDGRPAYIDSLGRVRRPLRTYEKRKSTQISVDDEDIQDVSTDSDISKAHEGHDSKDEKSDVEGHNSQDEKSDVQSYDQLILQHVSSFPEIDREILHDNDENNFIHDDKWEELINQTEESDIDSDCDENDMSQEDTDDVRFDEDEDDNFIIKDNQPIYEGHSLTIQMSLMLILTYAMTHSINGVQLNDLLTLIGLHCMATHPVYKSVHRFKKYFSNLKTPLVKNYYCAFCFLECSATQTTCTNGKCLRDLTVDKARSYFLRVPIESQLRTLFQREEFVKGLAYRSSRKTKSNVIGDIYDGKIYQSFIRNNGPLSAEYPYNISFTWNTDGVPIFKSSNISIWPLFLMINELSPKNRRNKDNMIFYGLWIGSTKPVMTLFTKPLLNSLRNLETEGIQCKVWGKNEEFTVRGFLICGTADLPAKSTVMNTVQFNGAYSCLRCLDEGMNFRTKKGGNVRIFLSNKNETSELRTANGSKENAVDAVQTKQTQFGIKGTSFLMALNSYDYIKSSSIDYMHGTLLGLSKLLLKLWFTSGYSKEDFSLYKFLDTIDDRLSKIKPPHFITRVPRSIKDHLKYWKASEMKSWLFYYSLPVLKDFMPVMYWMHYAAFVEGIYLLTQSTISIQDIDQSFVLLSWFVKCFPQFYGNKYCTLNLHSLLHLPDMCRDLGPLWVYSCFPFEDLNGELTKLFHGTQHVDLQIVSTVNIFQCLPSITSNLIPNSPPHKFFMKLKHRNIVSKHVTEVRETLLHGKGYEIILGGSVLRLLASVIGVFGRITFYNRVTLRGIVYHSTDYTMARVRNSFTIKYVNEGKIYYGVIQRFGVHSPNCDCFELCVCVKHVVVFISRFTQCSHPFVPATDVVPKVLQPKVNHLKAFVNGQFMDDVIETHGIISLCLNVSFDDDTIYICEPVNTIECD